MADISHLFSLNTIRQVDGITALANQISKESNRRDLIESWRKEYLRFLTQRFNVLSGGGGNWPPLSPKTLARRAKRGNSSTKILKDTGQILAGLQEGRGHLTEVDTKSLSLRIGYGGNAVYHDPDRPKRRKRIETIVRGHQSGNPRLRQIVVGPNQRTTQRIDRVTRTWVGRMLKKIGK